MRAAYGVEVRPWPLVLVLLAAAAMPQSAVGCCISSFDKEYTAQQATLVFTGVVTSVDGELFGMTCSTGAAVLVTFAVERVYKGEARRTTTIRTSSPATCGYAFRSGRRYTVFAQDGMTTSCFGNVEGTVEPAEYGLGAGRSPTD